MTSTFQIVGKLVDLWRVPANSVQNHCGPRILYFFEARSPLLFSSVKYIQLFRALDSTRCCFARIQAMFDALRGLGNERLNVRIALRRPPQRGGSTSKPSEVTTLLFSGPDIKVMFFIYKPV